MAIWQFDFYVIPRENQDIADIEQRLLWEKLNIDKSDLKFVPDFLESKVSWCKDILQYGDLDKTCMELSCEGSIIETIFCRLDLRECTDQVLQNILSFIIKVDGLVCYEEKIYLPERKIILELIKNSAAAAFCRSPEEFLKSLSNQNF